MENFKAEGFDQELIEPSKEPTRSGFLRTQFINRRSANSLSLIHSMHGSAIANCYPHFSDTWQNFFVDVSFLNQAEENWDIEKTRKNNPIERWHNELRAEQRK